MEENFKSNQERKMNTEIQSCEQIAFKSDSIINPMNCVINKSLQTVLLSSQHPIYWMNHYELYAISSYNISDQNLDKSSLIFLFMCC